MYANIKTGNNKVLAVQYRKQVTTCPTEVMFVKGIRAEKLFPLPKPLQFKKNWRKKEASLVDKSSFSSWLHTAAGGLTCHRRIQPLIHLCFPQVFLNFTHRSRAITESEPGFLCQTRRHVFGLSSPRQCSVIWEPQSRTCPLIATDKSIICHFQTKAHLFTFQLLHWVTSESLSFFNFYLYLSTLPKSTALHYQPWHSTSLHAHLLQSAPVLVLSLSRSLSFTEHSGLSIYLGGPPFGPKHPWGW